MKLKQLNALTESLMQQGVDPELEIEEWVFGGGDVATFVNVDEILQALRVPGIPSMDPGIFGGYHITRQRLKREELLKELRHHVNSGYMPSSERKGFNSKPEYVRWLDMALAGHPHSARGFDCTGYFKRTDEWGYTKSDDPIWAYIETNQFEYVVNLQTDEIRIRRTDGIEWTVWSDETLVLAEDKRELFEVIDNFL